MRKCSNSTNSMFEEQEAKSYTEETGVFANHHISGGDTGIQKRETIDYEIRATYASLRKSEKKVADYDKKIATKEKELFTAGRRIGRLSC